MRKIYLTALLLIFAISLVTQNANAGVIATLGSVTYSAGNGHTYQLVQFDASTTWHDARDIAASTVNDGLVGHLATFTSAEEWSFVLDNLIDPNVANDITPNYNNFAQGWIGATDELSEGVWQWVTGEAFSYTPGGFDASSGSEDYAQVWDFTRLGDLRWNDISSPFNTESTDRAIFEFDPANTAPVPEPSTAIAIGWIGLVGFAGYRRPRRRSVVK